MVNKSNKISKPAKKLSNKIKSRKESRKEKRQEKKIKRRTHQTIIKENREKVKSKKTDHVPGTASENGKFVKRINRTAAVNDDITSEIESNFSLSDEETNQKMKKIAEQSKLPKTSCVSTAELMWQKEKESEKKLQKKFSKVRIQQLKLANKDEDKIIKKLEKKLGIDKKPKGTIPKFNDGLDELLELCTTEKVNELFENSKKIKRIGFDETYDSDLQDDFEEITNGNPKKKATSDDEEQHDNADDSEVSEEYDQDDATSEQNDANSIDDNHDEQEDSDDESIENDEENDKKMHSDIDNENKSTRIRTDIYGRDLNELGNVIQDNKQKYIPPHLKNRNPADDEKLMRLKRQLKGQINRLTEINLPKIAKEIENLYMHNSRHDMNSILTTLIFDALITSVLAPERTVLEHLLLLGALHANIGCEVGAYFLEKTVERFDEYLETILVTEIENKRLDNIVQIICHLYTFKIISQQLVFEIIHKLVKELNEKVVECVLIILKSIGFTLRKDDPSALKDLIVCMQKQANEEIAKVGDNLRLKFMLDILLAIKNNNMKKIPQYDPELAEQLKKQLKALCVNGKFVTTLNIALNDLLNVNERGKWWVIGSAWTGSDTIKGGSGSKSHPVTEKESFSQKLLDLARQQRMNTDEKRLLFCTIMSAEDYVEAFEKLMHIKIKDFNVLTSILIHCCLAEKDYNPYYSILAQKLCDFDRKYQLALKFSIWDKIHNLETLNSSQITNFSKFIIYLIKESGLALSILKVIQFSELDKISLKLVRKIMVGILLVVEEEQFIQIFKRITPSMQLKTFKDGLRLFMEHFLLRASIQSGLKDAEKILLKKRIKSADSILASTISNIL